MSPKDTAELTGVGRGTLNNWTLGEFRPYFSPSAQGGEGRNRDFTEHDLRLLVLLKSLTDSHTSREEIHATLQHMQANEWDGLPPMPTGKNSAVVPVVPTAAADAALISERRVYVAQIELLNDQLQQAQQQAEQERARNEPLLREIGELKAELARAQLMLELYESGRLKPRE